MEVGKAIISRRSIRKFLPKPIPPAKIKAIIEAGSWAPSGLNNQPWRFLIVKNSQDKLAAFTHYQEIVKNAATCIAVFLDHQAGYNRVKDLLAIGACIQNMILKAHSLGIGTCWLGEILNKKEMVNRLYSLPSSLELTAVIALGYPAETPKSHRKKIEELILKEV